MSRTVARLSALAVASSAAVAAVVVSLVVPAGAAPQAAPTPASGVNVSVAQGALRGVAATGYDAWLGVPYAQPPVGALRWKAPKPAGGWTGVRDASTFGARCVQGSGWDPGYENVKLDENCLSLNVYAPEGARADLPVLVWIHGGGFTGGAGQDTDPRRYVQANDAIVVTVNYRLGIMGFLNLPQLAKESADGTGNFGLLDQQAALRWVDSNIGSFGGDGDNVTIAGQSAGGSSVCDQVASPTAAGLFQKAVIMSGGCSMDTATSSQATSQRVVAALGCANVTAVLACVRQASPAQVLAVQTSGISPRPSLGGKAFPLDPATAVKTGAINKVPMMVGQVHDERRLTTFQNYDYVGKPISRAQFRAMVTTTYGASAPTVLANYPLDAYSSPSIAWATVASDAASATRKLLDDQLSRWTSVYVYEFAVEDTPQFASIYQLQQTNATARAFDFGATHVDDLPYLWEYLGQTLPLTDDQLALSDQMTQFWDRFQRSGNPNADGLPTWRRYTTASPVWMNLTACHTPPSGNRLPAACSLGGTGYLSDHKIPLWVSVIG